MISRLAQMAELPHVQPLSFYVLVQIQAEIEAAFVETQIKLVSANNWGSWGGYMESELLSNFLR